MTAFTRAHCICVVVQNYDYDEAAAKLKISRRWLEDNVARLPRQKYGKSAAVFCDCDLRLIQAMHAVMPPEAAAHAAPAAQKPTPTEADTPAYVALRPSRGRKKQTAGV